MRGKVSCSCPFAGQRQTLALISQRAGAADSFSLRAKSRLRRLRSDTRLRAQPSGKPFTGFLSDRTSCLRLCR